MLWRNWWNVLRLRWPRRLLHVPPSPELALRYLPRNPRNGRGELHYQPHVLIIPRTWRGAGGVVRSPQGLGVFFAPDDPAHVAQPGVDE
jgi:hypothetical protein